MKYAQRTTCLFIPTALRLYGLDVFNLNYTPEILFIFLQIRVFIFYGIFIDNNEVYVYDIQSFFITKYPCELIIVPKLAKNTAQSKKTPQQVEKQTQQAEDFMLPKRRKVRENSRFRADSGYTRHPKLLQCFKHGQKVFFVKIVNAVREHAHHLISGLALHIFLFYFALHF